MEDPIPQKRPQICAITTYASRNFIAIGTSNGKVKVFDSKTLAKKFSLAIHTKPINNITLIENYIICSASGCKILIIDLNIQCLIKSLKLHSKKIIFILPLNKTPKLITAGKDKMISLLSMENFENIDKIGLQSYKKHCCITCLYIKEDDSMLFSADQNGRIKLWPMNDYSNYKKLTHGKSTIISIKAIKKILFSGGYDGCVKMWKLDTLELCNTLNVHEIPIYSMFITENINGNFYILVNTESYIKCYEFGENLLMNICEIVIDDYIEYCVEGENSWLLETQSGVICLWNENRPNEFLLRKFRDKKGKIFAVDHEKWYLIYQENSSKIRLLAVSWV